MKPAAIISIVVVAVLTTVVIEEVRIKKLQAEILRLRTIPTDQPIKITPEDILSRETPLPGRPPLAPIRFDESEEPAAEPEVATPAPAPEPEPETPALPGLRNLPADYPEPADDRIKEVALGAYSDLHYELGLNNQERVYLDDLLLDRQMKQQELAQSWIAAEETARGDIEQEMQKHLDENNETIRSFLGRDADYETFATYHAMQPERTMVGQLIPLMDQQGISLELANEQKLVSAMHNARTAAGGIDWNSAAALRAVVAGDAEARFEKEWSSRTESLQTSLPEFLDAGTLKVVMESREQLKATMLEALQSAIETINGEEEETEEE